MGNSCSTWEAIKAFGMTNQLLEADLDRIEKEHKIDLRRHGGIEQLEESYYQQFDESVRTEAAGMSRHYEVFYCLEKTIRAMIAETLQEQVGAKWWDSGNVPPAVHTKVTERIQKEVDSGITVRSDDPIDYTTFGELGDIIKHNWPTFGGIFQSARAVERVLANLNLLRGPIAHCSVLAEDEVVRLELSLRDWFRLME